MVQTNRHIILAKRRACVRVRGVREDGDLLNGVVQRDRGALARLLLRLRNAGDPELDGLLRVPGNHVAQRGGVRKVALQPGKQKRQFQRAIKRPCN